MRVSGFRNLADQEIRFEPGLNLLTGDNGEGKSSVLEAVYLLGTSRSFRTSRLFEVVRIDGGPARVSGDGENPGESLAVLIGRQERLYVRHGKTVPPSEYIGTLDVVALSSEIVQGFRRQPSERRRFLDRMALSTYPGYLDELRELRRACAQRAALAASGARGGERRAWDARAAELAIPVARRRREMAEALEGHLREAARSTFPEGRSAAVRLVSRPAYTPVDEGRYVEDLTAVFAAQEPAGGRRETPAGPLRDDLTIEVEGKDLLRFGSAGQVRSLVTAAALAEMNRLLTIKGRYPVLVLDDADADLDEGRYASLVSALGAGAQVFAAASKGGFAAGAGEAARRFAVRRGVVAAAA